MLFLDGMFAIAGERPDKVIVDAECAQPMDDLCIDNEVTQEAIRASAGLLCGSIGQAGLYPKRGRVVCECW